MRIRRMTITLPPRFRGRAAQEARRIAEAAAESMGAQAPRRLSVAVRAAPDTAAAVGRDVAARTRGEP